MDMRTNRLIEIDALRGLAVACMIVFHAAVDAQLLGFFSFDPAGWPLIVLVRAVQFLFLGLVGVSVYLSGRGVGEQVGRGLKVFLCGMVVTLATWVVFPDEYVRFGVLQCIGLSIPVVALFKKRPVVALAVAAAVFGLGEWFLSFTVETPWLLWLGPHRADFVSLDYFPLLPWMAVPLVGLFVGSILYAERQPTALAGLGHLPGLSFLGRHALAVYLLHQPVLYFTLWAFSHWL